MALYRHDKQIFFNEIRVILSLEGFYINNKFVIKELGFKSCNLNSVIYFKTDTKIFKEKDLKTTYFLSNFIHGLSFYKNNEYWMSSNDYKAVIKTIYQLTETEDKSKIYIGYSNDINLLTILHNSGLDKISVNLKEIYKDIPTIKAIKRLSTYGFGPYTLCQMHNESEYYKYQCAKVKSLILYDWCLDKYQQQLNKNGID